METTDYERSMRRRGYSILFAAATSFAVTGCYGHPALEVDTKNTSDQTYIIRFEPEDDNLTVSNIVGPNSSGITLGGMIYVGWRGRAVVMTEDCQVVDTLPIVSDSSFLQITDEGATIQVGRAPHIDVTSYPETDQCD